MQVNSVIHGHSRVLCLISYFEELTAFCKILTQNQDMILIMDVTLLVDQSPSRQDMKQINRDQVNHLFNLLPESLDFSVCVR